MTSFNYQHISLIMAANLYLSAVISTHACMMAQSLPFTVLVAALFIDAFSYCSAENVYCVTSNATSCSSCPHNSTHCTALSEYAQEAELYFTSNTTMVFLSGDHFLDADITVANVARLTMHGETGKIATVVCNTLVGFSFTKMKEFKISSIAFTSCSSTFPAGNSNHALLLQSTQYTELVNCSFRNNPGTALVVINSNVTLAGNTEFIHNHCTESNSCVGGGGIQAVSSNLTFIGDTSFLENNQVHYGDGGAIYALNHSSLSFNGTSNFIGNSADTGGAIYLSHNINLTFNGISNFNGNSAGYGGAIYAFANSKLMFNGTINFTKNGYNKSGIVTQNGGATYGGAVFMGIESMFFIIPTTTVHWEKNHATFGGAICVVDAIPISYCASVATYVPKEKCFFQLPGQNLSNGVDVQLVFKNNSADVAGSALYGGAIDNCRLSGLESYSSGEVFDMIVHIDDTDREISSSISSDPLQICPCEINNIIPNCSESKYQFPYTVFPGETFQVFVVAVGQRNGSVQSTVRSTTNSGNLQAYQYLQQANYTCTELNYTLFSLSQSVNIDLHAEVSPCSKVSEADPGAFFLEVNINQTCPPGFALSLSEGSCICDARIQMYDHQCNITNGKGLITRECGQQFWVGYDNQIYGVILHPHCPFDYCVSHTVVFPLKGTDIQCAHNRSRLLCGTCKIGYSLVLGTSHCRMCNNPDYLNLLIPFAAMGIGLVFLLLVCKLTVATGTLSGLVFYANIVGANRSIFLLGESANVLSVFIAWLNLDFGIETCFYIGMDAYSKTWLQFVFPVYIWVLIGLIIFGSHYSRRFASRLGNNPVSVLATLILLSYAKILRTLIAAIRITYLEYPTYNRGVWLYDANIDYLSGKHIPLFIVAVAVFFFLFLPYTLLLLFGQWLQAISHLRLFSWVNSARLKPFMDSYHAPYKANHRYWPGLLLVLRFVLLLVVAFNFQEDPKTNLLAILVETGNLFLWLWISGGVYTNRYINILEGSFVLNLIILTVVTYCVNLFGGSPLIVEYTWTISVSIAFATFIGVLVFQLAKVTGIFQYLKRKCAAVVTRNAHQTEDTDVLPDRLVNPEEYEPSIHTPHQPAISEPAEGEELVNEAQRRRFPAYTYGSVN